MKVFKGQENLLLKNLQEKTRVENVRFLSWKIFFVGKYSIQSTNEMAFKRTVTLRASFRFPAIRFDAPKLLSFSGFTHAHAKCPPVSYVYLREHAQLTYQATSSSSNCCELNLSWNTIRAKTKKGQTKCSFFTGQLFICGYICRLLLLQAFPIYSFQGSFFYSDNSRYNTPNICVLSDNFRTTVCRSS